MHHTPGKGLARRRFAGRTVRSEVGATSRMRTLCRICVASFVTLLVLLLLMATGAVVALFLLYAFRGSSVPAELAFRKLNASKANFTIFIWRNATPAEEPTTTTPSPAADTGGDAVPL